MGRSNSRGIETNHSDRSRHFRALAAPVIAGVALLGASPAFSAEKPVKSKAAASRMYQAPVKTIPGAIARIQRKVRNEEALAFRDISELETSNQTCITMPVEIAVSGVKHWFILEQTNHKKPRLTTIRAHPIGSADEVPENPLSPRTPLLMGAIGLDPEGQPGIVKGQDLIYAGIREPCS